MLFAAANSPKIKPDRQNYIPHPRRRPAIAFVRFWLLADVDACTFLSDVGQIVDWYMEGKINIDDLITHTMPLEEINSAFDLMHEGKSIRSVVIY